MMAKWLARDLSFVSELLPLHEQHQEIQREAL
jgi:hypothetical protein